MALAGQKIAFFDKKVAGSGPVFQSIKIKGNKIKLSFTGCGCGLMLGEGPALKHFAIALDDGKFAWAKAEIRGNKVVIWKDAITGPDVTRYAWANNPEGANLCNREGIPAFPFQAGNLH